MILGGETKRRLLKGIGREKKIGHLFSEIVTLSPSRFYSCSTCTSNNEISLYKA